VAVSGIRTLLILHLHTPLHAVSSTRYIYQVAFLPFGLGPHHNAVDPEGDGAELLSDAKVCYYIFQSIFSLYSVYI
jgi:hypothetical protein